MYPIPSRLPECVPTAEESMAFLIPMTKVSGKPISGVKRSSSNQKEADNMKMMNTLIGMAAGAAIGMAAGYAAREMGGVSTRQVKNQAKRAVRAMEQAADRLS